MTDWTKELCASCKLVNSPIRDVVDLVEKLNRCASCKIRKVKIMGNKIRLLFLEQDQVSLQNDILPLVLEEFELSRLDEAAYAMAGEFVKQNLYAVHISGIQTVCHPVFNGEPQSGTLSVVDMVWEKVQIQEIEIGLTNLNK